MVAAHPYPLDVVLLDQFVQLHPEIDVLDRFPVHGAPAALFPIVNPGGDAVVHVLGIGVQANLARKYGPGLTVSFNQNTDLIGGLRVQVGSDVYDGSIRARLAELADEF